MTRGIRNKNPGNIRNSDATDWKGEVNAFAKKDTSFEEFVDMPHGYRALLRLLQNYRRLHGLRTIAQFIGRWAPAHENNTDAYIKHICKSLGKTSDYVIPIEDKDIMCQLAAAISHMENGIQAVMSDVYAGWELLNK